ncbi:MAG: carbohydrate ABC transporter permease [Anaerolineae bacterium]
MAVAAAARSAGHRGRLSKARREEVSAGLLFASPWLLNLVALTAYPVLAAIFYSFTEYTILRPPRFVGLANYIAMFTKDHLYWKTVYNTLYYSVFSVPLGLALALFLAIFLNQDIKGLAFFRTTFYLPSIVPTVCASMLWLWILNPKYGLINYLLGQIGLKPVPWLSSPTWSKPAFILMSLWGIGPATVIFLAALQEIPQHLYEAARIDGANPWASFRNITIPMLSPIVLFNLINGVIGSLQIFTQVYIISSGGPLDSTRFYVLYLYQNAFNYFKMGYASALALILFLAILLLTLVILRTSGSWVYYGGE